MILDDQALVAHVRGLELVMLTGCVGEQAREAEDAFVWMTHYERGFWDMAMSG